MNRDTIIERWRANTRAAGVRLTEEDIERIAGRGALDRVQAVDDIIARVDARETVPDYLAVLTAQSASGASDE